MTPRVYLAGPDVFDPDHARIFAERRRLCLAYGLEALTPVDSPSGIASVVFRTNVELLDVCHGVIANASPFRGPHCDVGTAWEMGYAVARGKPVFAFSSVAGPLIERVAAGRGVDAEGRTVEDFGLGENLMLALGAVGHKLHESFESALAAAARHFGLEGQGAAAAREG